MSERLASSSNEKGVLTKAWYAGAYVEVPVGIYGAGSALLALNPIGAIIAGGLAFGAYTHIREYGLPMERKSNYNPEKITRFFLDKLRNPSTRMTVASRT